MRTIESPEQQTLAEECVTEAVELHNKLMRAGLYKTGQQMHAVVQAIGYELADLQPLRAEGSERP